MPLSPLKSIASLLAKTASKEIPTVAEQSTGALTKVAAPNLSRRNFLKQTAGMAARQAVPDVVMGTLAIPSTEKAITAVARPVVEKAVEVAAPSSLGDISSALAAVNDRIKAHNLLAKKQAVARTEAGIEGLIEGHQPVIKTLRAESGIYDDAGNMHLIIPLLKKKMAEEGVVFTKDDFTAGVEDLIDKLSPETKKIKTGWKDAPELEHRYVPGVGHTVFSPSDRISYWLKSPVDPLHEDAIIQEYLKTMKPLVDY